MTGRVLVTGAGGQLGRELQRRCPADTECIALDSRALDISDRSAVLATVAKLAPDAIINAAAYTAVDGAETKPDLALAVNGEGAGYVALAAQEADARLLHVSTDFVFDGEASSPYLPTAETRPLGAYGHSKLAGECRVREVLPQRALVLRTAWVYSAFGGNFVKTMLKLMNERDKLRVVGDQVGAPTWASGLADVLWILAAKPEARGLHHWTDGGTCSWYEFACAIYEEGRALGLVSREVEIEEIPTVEYPTPAQRPAYSVLDCTSTAGMLGFAPTPWRVQLIDMLKELT